MKGGNRMKEFGFMNETISISDARNTYNNIRIRYKYIAQGAKQDFREAYIANNSNLDDVIDNVNYQAESVIYNAAKKTIDELVKKGIYNIDENIFLNEYCQNTLDIWSDSFNKIYDIYMDITLNEEQKKVYREQRKNSRGKWVGGGFGVKGALKGAAQAGAMNIASGLGHSAFNAIGNIGSSIKSNNQKNKIFNSKSTLDDLSDAIYDTIFFMHYSYIIILISNLHLDIDFINQNDIDEANIIFSNIKNRPLDLDEKNKLLKRIIELNPYDELVYKYIIDNFGDEKNEVTKICNYFGLNLDSYKENIIKNKCQQLDIVTEYEAKQSKEFIVNECKKLGIECKSEFTSNIDEKLREFDIKARTVENVLFKTREDAKLALMDRQKIRDIMVNTDRSSEQSLLNAKDEILKVYVKLESVDNILNNIDKYLKEIDEKERTVGHIIFDTREEASTARKEKYDLDFILESIDINNPKSIKYGIETLDNYNFTTSIAKVEINKLNNRLREIDEQSRTVKNILFDTQEEANLAKEEVSQLELIIQNLDLNNETSLIKTKREIQSKSFKTSIVNIYLDMINENLNKIYESVIEESKAYDKQKDEFKSLIMAFIFFIFLGLFLLPRVGGIFKLAIIFFLICSFMSIKEERKKLKEMEKAKNRIHEFQNADKLK